MMVWNQLLRCLICDMPSSHANAIIRLAEDLIGKQLTTDETLQAEEIALNAYPGAATRWMRSWAKSLEKKGKAFGFDWFYKPIMNGIMVGAMKNKPDKLFKFDTTHKRQTYAVVHTYLGTDFSMRELEDIVWFTQYSTLSELSTAISVAQYHGVVNSAYVRAIIVGNRRKAAALLRAQDSRFQKVTQDPPDVKTGVPNVKLLQDAWTKRLKAAIARAGESELERSTSRKLSI